MIIRKTPTDPKPFQDSTWEHLLQTARQKATWHDDFNGGFGLERMKYSVTFPFRISALWCKMKIKALDLWYHAMVAAGKIHIRTSSVNQRGKIYQAVSENLGNIQHRLLLVWDDLALMCNEIDNAWVRGKCRNAVSNGVDATLNLHKNIINHLGSFVLKSDKNRHYGKKSQRK